MEGLVLATSRKYVLPAAVLAAFALGFIPAKAVAQAAQQPAGQQAGQAQKNWKDRAEYDLYESIGKAADANQRLTLLNQWKEKYPASEFSDLRDVLFMETYRQLGRGGDMLNAANTVLSKDPNNIQALGAAVTSVYTLPPNAPPDQLATVEKAANQLLSNADALFAADKKPANVSDADWGAAKKSLTTTAQTAIGLIAMRNKNNEAAEAAFKKDLEMDPNAAQVSYWLGTVILAEKNPAKQSEALYDFARAAAYDGPGALAPAGRAEVQKYLEKAYVSYHGSREGLDQLMAQAKTNPIPPADFKVVSKADLAAKQVEEENKIAAANPSLAIWKNVKTELTGAGGEAYFNDKMKGTLFPKMTGKLVSMSPETRPKELQVAIEDSTGQTADATLKMDAALAGKMDPGSPISFEGTPESFAANPFMVTFTVEKANLTGWKGTNPPPAKKHTTKKR
jgi:tetratricopeptide (TPR) repeat protein